MDISKSLRNHERKRKSCRTMEIKEVLKETEIYRKSLRNHLHSGTPKEIRDVQESLKESDLIGSFKGVMSM